MKRWLLFCLVINMSTPVAAQLVPEAEKYRISTGQYNQRQQQQQQYQAPSSPPIYMAVAIHPDSSEDWSTWGYPSTEAAEQAALGGCAQVMGDGCEIGASWSGRAQVAVVRDVGGNLWVEGADPQRNDAKRLALVKCLEESTGCEEVAVISNGANRGEHFAGRPPQRRTFAAIAWPTQDPGPKWHGFVWLVSGVQGYLAATNAVLQRCRTETGFECEIGNWDAGGALIRILDDEQRQNSWARVSDPHKAQARAQANCAKGRNCRAIEVYDSRTPRALTIDQFKGAKNPLRGFFSIAWPVNAAKSEWTKVAIARGQESAAKADTAAITLCEKESREKCIRYLDNSDLGVDQVAVVLQDSKYMTRVHFGISPAEAQRMKEKSCEKYAVICPEGRLIDLAEPTNITVDYSLPGVGP